MPVGGCQLDPAALWHLSSSHFSLNTLEKPFIWVLCEDDQVMSGLVISLLNWDTFWGYCIFKKCPIFLLVFGSTLAEH